MRRVACGHLEDPPYGVVSQSGQRDTALLLYYLIK